MGKNVKQAAITHEKGLRGFFVGRGGHLVGNVLEYSLDDDGEGRPWTFHDPSPLVLPSVMKALRKLARMHQATPWVEAVALGCPVMGTWLEGLSEGERGMVWEEARLT